MKTYPYTTPDGIIDLIRRDEHDVVVSDLQRELAAANASSENELFQMVQADNLQLLAQNERLIEERNKLRADNTELNERLSDFTQSHLHAEARNVQTIQRQAVLLDRLATTLGALIHDCNAHAKDIIKIRWGHDGDSGSKLSAEQIEECCDSASQALAAYDAAKAGNLPDLTTVTSDFDNSAAWTTQDFQRALQTIERLRQENRNTLAEAVKQMEAVDISELSKPYEHAADFHSSDAGLRAVRARLILAAKGGQP